MKKFVLAAAFVAFTFPAQAQAVAADTAVEAKPAMWKVSDADTTIYLFGTFHMLDGKQNWFTGPVKEAFERSDKLVVEAVIPENQAEMQPLVMRYALDASGRTLSQRLPGEVTTRLGKELSAFGVPLAAVEPMKPWFVGTMLATLGAQKLGLTGEQGADMVLKRAAKQAGKPVAELESVEFQLKMLDGLEEEQQINFLTSSLDHSGKLAEVFHPMLAAWSGGDVDGLVTILNESLKEDPVLYRVMLTDRNATWADWIEQRLTQPGTVFVAVGAGHLAGEGSVQQMLEQRGYTVNRVH